VSPGALARLLLLATSTALAGCGYVLANAPDPSFTPFTPFTVGAADATIPDGAVISAAVDGAQRELARAGLLSARGDGPVLTIAVESVREQSEGIERGPSPRSTPVARGIRLRIVGRATSPAAAGAPARDSGAIEVTEIVASTGSAAIGSLGRDEAAQRAGRRLGERLVRRVLGDFDPGEP
jgi:hypothetical protein